MLYTWSTQCTWMIDTCICTTKRLKHKTWQNQIFVKEKKNFSLNAWFTLQFDYYYFYISSDSCVLYGGSMLHNPRINRLKSWVWFWLLEGKRGANEQLIKMRGDYVLICKGDKSLIPLIFIIFINFNDWSILFFQFDYSVYHKAVSSYCVTYA